MNVFFLKESGFPPVPDELAPHVFGSEAVVDVTGKVLARGLCSSIYNEDAEKIAAYLRSCGDAVWCTNNPMLGMWNKRTIKSDFSKVEE
jgi:hypothetical protein